MTANAIVILNLNDFMPSKARASFHHARERWKCDLIEIVSPLGQMHHFWQKALIPLSKYTEPYERILQLDTDMLIRSDCPSPFDIVPVGSVGVVSRVQPGIGHGRFEGRKARWSRRLGITPYTKEKFHLNCGLVLYEPRRHRELLKEWADVGRRNKWPTGWITVPEQFVLSCLLQSMPVAVEWMHWHFNTLRATHRRVAPPGKMKTYVYHFNGPRGRNLPRAMRKCEWRIKK